MEFLVPIAAAVALIWVAVAFIRGGLLAGCVIVLLAGCVFGSSFFSVPAKPIPLTADRLLWLVLLLQYAVFRRWGFAEPRPLCRADMALLALFAVLALSTFSNDWSAHNNQPAARLLFQWIMPAGFYFVARESRLTRARPEGISDLFRRLRRLSGDHGGRRNARGLVGRVPEIYPFLGLQGVSRSRSRSAAESGWKRSVHDRGSGGLDAALAAGESRRKAGLDRPGGGLPAGSLIRR